MNRNHDIEKYGLTGIMVAAFLGGIFTEGRNRESSTVFFSLAMITFGMLILMIGIDWWRGSITKKTAQQEQDSTEQDHSTEQRD